MATGERGVGVWLAAVLAALAMGVAACGDDDEPATASDGDTQNAASGGKPVAGEVEEGAFDGETFVWSTVGGSYLDAQEAGYTEPFSELTGARVATNTQTTDLAKLAGMVESGNVEWDAAGQFDYIAESQCGTLFQPIDKSLVDLSHVDERFVGKCFVPFELEPYVMVYDKEEFGDNPPTKLEDYFDTETYPGPRGLEVIPGYPEPPLIEMALQADGVAVEDLYPVDFERAYDKFCSISDDLKPVADPVSLQTQMENKEVVMSIIYSPAGEDAAANGATFEPVWDKWSGFVAGGAIPKGVKNPEMSHAFLNFALGAEQQEAFSEEELYPSTNRDASPSLSEDELHWVPSQEDLEAQHFPDSAYYADAKNYEKMDAAYTKFLQECN
jgi:putative spermidine/putrescine transport system substrate-binding protein